jgi:hypothetical protein
MRFLHALVVGVLALVLSAPPGTGFTVSLVDSPDVIAANQPNKTYKNPDYPFSTSVEIRNDDEPHNVTMGAITYLSRDVDGCPKDRSDTPRVDLVQKRLELDPQETRRLGGLADARQANQRSDEYWPMAVSREYQTQDGRVEYEEGTHSFCVNAIDTDCAAVEGNSVRDCSLDEASWTSYVRRTNEAPYIQSWEITPSDPQPGQSIRFSAQAADNSTQPEADTLRSTWDLAGTEKTGKVVRHTFDVGAEHTVRLHVTDGFDTTTRERSLAVFEPGEAPSDPSNDSPWSALVAIVALSLAARVARE